MSVWKRITMATDPTKSKQAPVSHDREGAGETPTAFSEVTDNALQESSPLLQTDGSTDSKSMVTSARLMKSSSRDVNRRVLQDTALESTHNELLKYDGVTSLHVRSFLLDDFVAPLKPALCS